MARRGGVGLGEPSRSARVPRTPVGGLTETVNSASVRNGSNRAEAARNLLLVDLELAEEHGSRVNDPFGECRLKGLKK